MTTNTENNFERQRLVQFPSDQEELEDVFPCLPLRSELTTEQKIKELEKALTNVKLDMTDKERLTEIYNSDTSKDDQNKELHGFLKELAVK